MLALLCAGMLTAGCSSEQADRSAPDPGAASVAVPAAPADVGNGKGQAAVNPRAAGTTTPAAGPTGHTTAPAPTEPATTGPGAAAPGTVGSEVVPEPEASVTADTSLVERLAPRGPLVQRPLPRAALTRNRLVAGFPTVLRPAPGSRVDTSSISVADPRLQATLVASTSRSLDSVLRTFRVRFSRWGLRETSGAAAAGDSQVAAFVRGRSTVSVTAGRQGDDTTYQVFATLHAGR